MPNRASTNFVAFMLLLAIFVFGCASAQGTQKTTDEKIKSLLGSAYSVNYNETKKFALYQQSRVNDHVNRSFKYVVVRLSDNKILNQGSFRKGYVKWIDATKIEVASATKGETISKTLVDVDNQNSY
jgi:hypothetical protein